MKKYTPLTLALVASLALNSFALISSAYGVGPGDLPDQPNQARPSQARQQAERDEGSRENLERPERTPTRPCLHRVSEDVINTYIDRLSREGHIVLPLALPAPTLYAGPIHSAIVPQGQSFIQPERMGMEDFLIYSNELAFVIFHSSLILIPDFEMYIRQQEQDRKGWFSRDLTIDEVNTTLTMLTVRCLNPTGCLYYSHVSTPSSTANHGSADPECQLSEATPATQAKILTFRHIMFFLSFLALTLSMTFGPTRS